MRLIENLLMIKYTSIKQGTYAVSNLTKEPKQLDKIKVAGLSLPESKKHDYTILKFSVNNSGSMNSYGCKCIQWNVLDAIEQRK